MKRSNESQIFIEQIFSWVCASNLPSDLKETDRIAQQVIEKLMLKPDRKIFL